MSDITVRPAKTGDGERLAAMWVDDGRYYASFDEEMFRAPDTDGLVEFFEKDLVAGVPADHVWLVAEAAGTVAGSTYAALEPPNPEARWQIIRGLEQHRVYIHQLGVDAAYRRRGVATALVRALEDWGRERGASLIRLDTWYESPLSVPFYERIGYRRRSIIFEKQL